jgi:predicted extracellular nuclease
MRKVLPTLLTTGLLTAAVTTASLVPAATAGAVGGGSVSLTAIDAPTSQDFDTLASTGTNSVLPLGWYFVESGTNANLLYTAGTGSANAGDTYSFGAAGSAERAFGGLLSGSLVPTIGVQLTNDTGATISGFDIAYTGEQWRLGTLARADRLDAQFSIDATNLTAGTWTDVDALDFNAPTTGPTLGALDGNAAANRTSIVGSIVGLAVAPGASVWVRWSDFNATGADDGLSIDDVTITPRIADVAPSVGSSVPANGATDFPIGSNLTVTFSEAVAVAPPWFTLECSVSGAVDATFSGGPTSYTIDPAVTLVDGETCTLTVLAAGVTDADGNDPPDTMTVDFTVGFTALDPCLAPFTPISAIQGSGPTAAITGAVTTQGVVVGDFEGSAANSGFFIQDPVGDGDVATSDGIFVFTGAGNAVASGQVVRVTGFARERFNQTAINGSNSNTAVVTDIIACGTGSVAPTDVTLPFADANTPERYEGMLVRFPQPLVIAEYFNYDRFGEMVLAQPLPGETRPYTPTAIDEPGAPALARAAANALSRITLDDNQSAQNPSTLRHPNGQAFSLANRFRGGDTVANTTGVLAFDFSLYRVFPTQGADYLAVNERPPAPDPVGGSVQVAAMNTLNFYVTPDYPNTPPNPLDNACGPLNTLECRGWDADQPLEFDRQRDKLLAALTGLDADVIGLNELENSTGVEPLQSIVAGLPGYDYVATGTIGTDAIKVGMIYRPEVVTPVGDFRVLTSAVDPRFIDSKSRPALAQTFEVNATGARFTVVVNHFKSKGSDCNDIGDLDARDGSGNCNGTRTLAAQALVDWLATDPTGSGDPDFLIMGDLNAYAKETPIDAILAGPDDAPGTGDDYTNLIETYQGPFAYSFTFDGQAGYLDHSLASASMVGQVTGAADWHINSDEPDIFDYDTSFKPPAQDALYEPTAIRSSDHDPVVVGLNPVNVPPTADAGGPYTVIEDGTVTLTATGVDPEGTAVTFDWDLDGDGTFETSGQSVPFTPTANAPSVVTVTVRASDAFGNFTTDAATVSVLYDFSGFFSPIDNPPVVNEIQAGRTVPIRFSLDGFHGFDIFDGAPALALQPCTNGPVDRVEATLALNASFLTYDPFTDQYIYVWRTDRAWRRQCGELTVNLADGTSRTALFRFR